MIQVTEVNLKGLDFKQDSKAKDNKKSSSKLGEDFTKVFDKNVKQSSKNEKKLNNKEKNIHSEILNNNKNTETCKIKEKNAEGKLDDELKEEENKRKIKKQAEEIAYSILGIFNEEDTINKIKEKLKESIGILEDLGSIENINKKEVLNELLKKYNLKDNSLQRLLGSFISLGESQGELTPIENLKSEIQSLFNKIEKFKSEIDSKNINKDVSEFKNIESILEELKNLSDEDNLKDILAMKSQDIKNSKHFKENENLKSIEDIKNSLKQNLVSFKEDIEEKVNIESKNNNTFISSINNDEKDFLKILTKDSKEDKAIPMDKVHLGLNKLSNLKLDNLEGAKQIKMPVINKYTFNNDIIKSLKFMNLNNLKELSVRIVPRELGELVIKVSVENGVMKANISSTTKETYQLLQNNAKEILSKLQGESIRVEEFSVDIYDQNTTANNSENLKDRNESFNNSHSQKSWKSSSNGIENIVVEEGKRETVDIEDVINILA